MSRSQEQSCSSGVTQGVFSDTPADHSGGLSPAKKQSNTEQPPQPKGNSRDSWLLRREVSLLVLSSFSEQLTNQAEAVGETYQWSVPLGEKAVLLWAAF